MVNEKSTSETRLKTRTLVRSAILLSCANSKIKKSLLATGPLRFQKALSSCQECVCHPCLWCGRWVNHALSWIIQAMVSMTALPEPMPKSSTTICTPLGRYCMTFYKLILTRRSCFLRATSLKCSSISPFIPFGSYNKLSLSTAAITLCAVSSLAVVHHHTAGIRSPA